MDGWTDFPAPDSSREGNLGRVLRLVHESSGISRSALTRQTGLSRSTVGNLIADLSSRGLVFESAPDPAAGVGRPSPTVHAAHDLAAICIVPEIDAITLGVVGFDGVVDRIVRLETSEPPTPARAVELISSALADLSRDPSSPPRVVGIGLSVPGLVRVGDGLVRSAPHLGWVDEPFTDALAHATGLTVHAANDANLGALAEHLYGAGRGANDLVYINGGASGIGSGIISSGRRSPGAPATPGSWGTRSSRRTGSGATAAPSDASRPSSRSRRCSPPPTSHPATRPRSPALSATPSPALQAVVDAQVAALAIAIRNVLHTVNADVVVLGGFLGLLLESVGDRLSLEVTNQTMPAIAETVRIVPTQLGSAILLRAPPSWRSPTCFGHRDPARHVQWPIRVTSRGVYPAATTGAAVDAVAGSAVITRSGRWLRWLNR